MNNAIIPTCLGRTTSATGSRALRQRLLDMSDINKRTPEELEDLNKLRFQCEPCFVKKKTV